ncbi:hypothetical protein [Kineosporia mesophila]|nr:hypothetical protein [Kineosporia mesophila]
MRRRSVVVASVIGVVPVLWAIAWWQRPDGTVATDRTPRSLPAL